MPGDRFPRDLSLHLGPDRRAENFNSTQHPAVLTVLNEGGGGLLVSLENLVLDTV